MKQYVLSSKKLLEHSISKSLEKKQSIRYLLCARHCAKYIAYANVLNFCSKPMILVVLTLV